MLRRRPHPYTILCSPAVSRTLIQSTSSNRCQNQQDHASYDVVRTLPKDHLTHYRGGLLMNSTAACLRIENRSRTDGFKKTVQFVKSGPFVSIRQLPWCTSALHSTVNSHQSSRYAVQYRPFSLSATANYNGTRFNNVVNFKWNLLTTA